MVGLATLDPSYGPEEITQRGGKAVVDSTTKRHAAMLLAGFYRALENQPILSTVRIKSMTKEQLVFHNESTDRNAARIRRWRGNRGINDRMAATHQYYY